MKSSEWLPLLDGNKPFVTFSGGKDSAATLAFVKEALDSYAPELASKLEAIYADTTIGLPNADEYVIDFCKRIGVPLVIVKPAVDYFTRAEKWGTPRPRARWCCFELKLKPIRDYLRRFPNHVVLDGMRRKESRRRANFPMTYQHRHLGFVIHPIIDWTSDDVESYLQSRGLPINPAYDFGFSSWECWCGVCKRESEFKALKEKYPDFFNKLVELESKMKSGFAYTFKQGNPLYLRDL